MSEFVASGGPGIHPQPVDLGPVEAPAPVAGVNGQRVSLSQGAETARSPVTNAEKALAKFRDLTGIDIAWKQDAACANTPSGWWFRIGPIPPEVTAICDGCPVKAQCLHYAVEAAEPFGTWGGVSARVIRQIRTNPTRRLMVRLTAEIEAGKEAG